MVKICLSPVVSSRVEPCVAKYRLLRTDTGYGVELFFFCLSARRYDPLFRFWRGEARPRGGGSDLARASAPFRRRRLALHRQGRTRRRTERGRLYRLTRR